MLVWVKAFTIRPLGGAVDHPSSHDGDAKLAKWAAVMLAPKHPYPVRSGAILIRFASNLVGHSLRTPSNIFQEYSLLGYA